MALFKKKSKTGEHEILQEGGEQVMHINYYEAPAIPAIETDPLCMAQVIEKLAQDPGVIRIIFHQTKNYEYGPKQTQLLVEIANIYNHYIKQKKLLTSLMLLGSTTPEEVHSIQNIILNLLRTDPLGAYVEAKRLLREEKIRRQQATPYSQLLSDLLELLEKTQLMQITKNQLAGYEIGKRDLYKTLFQPTITPNFMFTRLMATPPLDATELDTYNVGKNITVQIYQTQETIKPLYHIIPPEFRLSEDKYALIDLARSVLAEHQPQAEEFIDPERMRQTFFNIGRDLLTELADQRNLEISFTEIEEMADVLVRYTVGFGLIEILLQDPKVQDIAINGPIGQTPIFIVHADYDECVTNIIPSQEDGESWATKLRLISARPLDEANPILDTELAIPGARARVAVISRPLNPWGLGMSIRRHRDKPWTLALFVQNKMISDLAAGVLSFIIDGARTILVAGTRSSGKTSLLGGILVELMRKYRILTIEDTLELSTDALRKLGHNIQPMKVRSALASSGTEVAADEGIRTSLRMGDSALIVGEIRSKEALALYEAMRVGALANVVAGTIHGDSPYGVFDRVVNDLNVPRTSFKATDIIIVANPVRTADGLHRKRRVTQITEVRKTWEEDPLREGGFVDLFKYNSVTDTLEPTDALLNGESEIIKSIGGQVKEWAGNWDAIWENIQLRAKIKRTQVDYAMQLGIPQLLEAESTMLLNDEFHKISDDVRTHEGQLDIQKILFYWQEALKKHIRQTYKRSI